MAVKLLLLLVIAMTFSFCGKRGVTIVNSDAGKDDSIELAETDVETANEDHFDTVDAVDVLDIHETGPDFTLDLPYDLQDGCNVPIMDIGDGTQQVTCLHAVRSNWDVSNGKVAYSPGSTAHGIFLRDIETGEEFAVREEDRTFSTGNFHGLFSFSENNVCYGYGHLDGGPEGVACTDIRTGNSRELLYCEPWLDGECCHVYEMIGYPDVQGPNVVWSNCNDYDPFTHSQDLYLFNLHTMEDPLEARRLTFDIRHLYLPSIWGNHVVFSKGMDIYHIDIETGEQRNLTDHPRDQWDPQIWNDIVVWVDHRNGPGGYWETRNSDIYWCRLPECEPQPATMNWAGQDTPAVEGEWIVWCDFRNDVNPLNLDTGYHDNIEIWGKNIRTGDEVQIVSIGKVINNHMKIDNNKVFFLTGGIEGDTLTAAVFMKELPTL